MNNNNRKNIIPAMVMTTTMLSTVIATPAYAKEAYSTTALTQTMSTSSSYELEQFKSMLKQGILDVEMLSSVADTLDTLLNDVEKGKIDTYSNEFRSIVVSATLAIDMIDNSEGNLSAVNGSLDDAYALLEDSVWDNLEDLQVNIRFKDVKTSDWFNSELQSAAAHGLIDGKGDGLFDPQGTLTVAEAIKLAASARAMYDDELDSLSVNLGNGHWADNYVSYAKSKGIVNGVSELDKVITRDEMAKIFASALPTSEYEQINDTSLMPEKSVPSYVEQLFKAGIMVGDSEGFRLNDSITRAETACIINRVSISDWRVEATGTDKGSNTEDKADTNNTLGEITENGHTYYVYNDNEELANFEIPESTYEMLELVNNLRAENGLEPLKLSKELCFGCEKRAEELAVKYSPVRPNGKRGMNVLWEEYGINWRASREHIAKSTANFTVERAFNCWLNSEGHKANMLAEDCHYFGFAMQGKYVAQLFV